MKLRLLLLVISLLGLQFSTTFATGDGFTGPTAWQTGCGTCHGSQNANTTITIEGTNTVVTSGTILLKAVVTNASPSLTVGGINITALNQMNVIQPGLQVVPGSGLKLVSNQLTHSAFKPINQGVIEYDFEFVAPATTGSVLLRVAACMNVSDANASNFDQWSSTANPFIITIIENTQPNFLLKQSSLNFGTVGVGSNKVQTLSGVIKNTGNSPLTISTSNFTGDNSGEFKIAPNGLPDSPIAPGDSADVILEFKPTGSGVRTAIFSINSNAQGGPRTIALSGIGKLPAILVINGTQFVVGNANVSKTVTKQFVGFIKNTGEEALNVTAIGFSGNDETMFGITGGNAPFTVLPSDSHAISVTFTPTSKGNKSTFLAIAANVEAPPADLVFTGVGTEPSLKVTPTTFDFGNVSISETSTQSINNAFTNTGNGPASISGFTLNGGTSSSFNVLTPSPIVIDNGAMLPFVVSFTPTVTGDFMDTINVISDNPTPVTLIVKGKGVQAGAITLSSSQITFGEVVVGQNLELALTIRNSSSNPCEVTGATVNGSSAFSVTMPPVPPIIPAMDSITININFEPTAEGVVSANVTATIPCDQNSPFTLTVTGTGKLPSSVITDKNNSFVSVTPNPIEVNAIIAINSNEPLKNGSVSIYDYQGREIYSISIPENNQHFSFNWNTTDNRNNVISSGMYSLVVRDQLNVRFVKSISVIK